MKIAIHGNILTRNSKGKSKSLISLMRSVHRNFPDIEFAIFYSSKGVITPDLGFPAETIIHSNSLFGRIILSIRLLKYDFVHFHANSFALWRKRFRVFPYIPKKKVVLVIHDVIPLSNPEHFKSKKKRADWYFKIANTIRKAGTVITVSNFSKKEIIEYFHPKQSINVLYNGFPQDVPAPAANRCDYYLYAGRYDPRKLTHIMLRDFLHSDKKRKLVMVGDIVYYSDEFRDMARLAKETGILEELGYVSESRLDELISNAKAMIYPSKIEGFGLPPLEAMKHGTPALTTRGTSLPEVCGDAALYFDPEIPGDLNRALDILESDEHLRSDLIRRGYENIRRFDIDKIAKEYVQILKEVQL